MARKAKCGKCETIWEVSALRPDSKIYICPVCDRKMGGPRWPIYLLKAGQDR